MEDQQLQLLARKAQYTMMMILVVATTLGILAMVAALCFIDLPDKNKDIFSNALMMIITAWVGVVGYFFGTSASSANKDDKPVKPLL